jgi:hypothetical protein
VRPSIRVMPEADDRPIDERVRFQVGDVVVERLADGELCPLEHSTIQTIDDGVCMTSSGRYYDRLTGRGLPVGVNYRAIHSVRWSVEPSR